jgi:cytochrome P450
VFGDSDRDCTMEDLNELKYLDYCLKEVLRLYPSAPLIERICKEEVKIGKNFKKMLNELNLNKLFNLILR